MFKKVICSIILMIISVYTLFSYRTNIENKGKKKVLVESMPYTYSGDYIDLSPMHEDLMDNKIFLIGESHGMKENYQIKKEMVKYVKEKNNFKYMLSEFSPADAYLYNQYMETGDISIINNIFESLEGTIGWTKQEYEFIQWVYSFNQTLKKEDRLIFIGSDIVHQFGTSIYVLKEIVSKHDKIHGIQEEIAFIKGFIFTSRTQKNMPQLITHLKTILAKIEENTEPFEKNYGKDYLYFHTILIGMIEGNDAYTYEIEYWNTIRDRAMYEIFQVYLNHLPEGKFFGQWGSLHTYQKSPWLNKSFATYLNEHKDFKNKIITILLYYQRSKTLDVYKGNYDTYAYSNFYPSFEMTKHNYTKNNTLYKLNDQDSMFTNKVEFPIKPYENVVETGVTTYYIQYFILFKNAAPCEPFSKDKNSHEQCRKLCIGNYKYSN